jgi:hypothetical protein
MSLDITMPAPLRPSRVIIAIDSNVIGLRDGAVEDVQKLHNRGLDAFLLLTPQMWRERTAKYDPLQYPDHHDTEQVLNWKNRQKYILAEPNTNNSRLFYNIFDLAIRLHAEGKHVSVPASEQQRTQYERLLVQRGDIPSITQEDKQLSANQLLSRIQSDAGEISIFQYLMGNVDEFYRIPTAFVLVTRDIKAIKALESIQENRFVLPELQERKQGKRSHIEDALFRDPELLAEIPDLNRTLSYAAMSEEQYKTFIKNTVLEPKKLTEHLQQANLYHISQQYTDPLEWQRSIEARVKAQIDAHRLRFAPPPIMPDLTPPEENIPVPEPFQKNFRLQIYFDSPTGKKNYFETLAALDADLDYLQPRPFRIECRIPPEVNREWQNRLYPNNRHLPETVKKAMAERPGMVVVEPNLSMGTQILEQCVAKVIKDENLLSKFDKPIPISETERNQPKRFDYHKAELERAWSYLTAKRHVQPTIQGSNQQSWTARQWLYAERSDMGEVGILNSIQKQAQDYMALPTVTLIVSEDKGLHQATWRMQHDALGTNRHPDSEIQVYSGKHIDKRLLHDKKAMQNVPSVNEYLCYGSLTMEQFEGLLPALEQQPEKAFALLRKHVKNLNIPEKSPQDYARHAAARLAATSVTDALQQQNAASAPSNETESSFKTSLDVPKKGESPTR